jgi:hypothetical protein
MPTGQAEFPQYPSNLGELRAEVDRLRAELQAIQQAQSAQAAVSEPGSADQQVVRSIGSSIVGSSIIAGQYNSADTATTLECTTPATILSLLNYRPGTSATGTPVGLYALANGIGIIVSAYGTPPSPVISKAVQAFCQEGEAIWADSLNGSAVFAHTTNGSAAIVADQGSASPSSTAMVALGGNGVGVYASGAKAAVQLGRSSFSGPPTSGTHEAGELVLDANANLYLCKVSGVPGTWNQIG